MSSSQLHRHTPMLAVRDARAALVRGVSYCRASAQETAVARITVHAFDVHGRDVAVRDPRAWNNASAPTRTSVHSLSGRTLFTDSNDAGWRLVLCTEAGPLSLAWDSRQSLFRHEYDDQLRPVALHEQASGEPSQVVERLTYAAGGDELAARNRCGRLLRHDDPAGTLLFDEYGLGGQWRVQRRRFLTDAQSADWPVDADARDALLEDGSGYASEVHCNATGDPVRRSDALGNRQWLQLDRAGQLHGSLVQMADSQQPRSVRQAIHYDAAGRLICETAGNGLLSELTFCPRDGRLQRQRSCLPGQAAVQDLAYQYDPVGNVLGVEDLAQPVTFHRNQRVVARQTLVYDSLYQLVEARGVEVDQPSHGPGLPPLHDLPLDPTRLVNYQQHYRYDAAGNLVQRRHGEHAGLRMAVAATSNRALPERPDGSLPDEAQIAAAHDACGNLVQLEGQAGLRWNARNQLEEVRQVERSSGNADYERYRYAADGTRVRKLAVAQGRSRMLHSEVRYLPGLELHRDAGGETRVVVQVDEHLRVEDQQWRYSLGDHLGSIAVELDGQGALLSHEVFYPFGGTAVWAARSAVQGARKRHRYCARERDASGLYCFGLRYYAPWLARWTSADPLGEVDGLNLYRMVSNNPMSLRDIDGGEGIPTQAHFFWAGKSMPAEFMQNVLMFKYHNPDWQVNLWTPKPILWASTMLKMQSEGSAAERYLAHRHGHEIVHRAPEEMFDDLAREYRQAHKIRSIYEREGSGVFPNYAAMSDVFRIGVLQAYGGLWMDGDVAVGGPVDLSRLDQDFYMHADPETGLASNAVLAAEQGSWTGDRLLNRMVREYSPQSSVNLLKPLASWVHKRSVDGAGMFTRLKLTMRMTGPDMLANVLGAGRIERDAGALPLDDFYSREAEPAGGAPEARSMGDVLYADYRLDLDGAGNWRGIRPGRRASIA